jgi:serine phosphatase RsbU (regulator of sigma subunit)
MKLKLILIIIICSFSESLFTQNLNIDSLNTELKNSEGTKKIKIYYVLGHYYLNFSPESAQYYFNLGLKLSEAVKNDTLIAHGCNNIGYKHYLNGKYNDAINYLFRALKIFEGKNLKNDNVCCLQYIGLVYHDLKLYDKARAYSMQALKISEAINDNYSSGVCLMMIGSIYFSQNSYNAALPYFEKALSIMKIIGDNQGISDALNNVALIYENKNDYKTALKFHNQSLNMAKTLNDSKGIAGSYHNIGIVYKKLNMNNIAIKYLDSSIVVFKNLNYKFQLKESIKTLAEIYAQTGRFDSAYKYQVLFSLYSDTLQNEETKKQFAEMSTKYESEKKDNNIKLLELEKQNQKEISTLENKRKNAIIISIIGGLGLMVFFSGFSFNRWRITKKQKILIELKEAETEKQKSIVEKKNIEITNSIKYALRIQSAILPSKNTFSKFLPNSFVLFKPKDIVSGDFYWLEVINDIVFVAACDCTGHGVPGALVSVICNDALNRSVKEFELNSPSNILNKTSELINENFAKSEKEIQDGMDISICALHLKTNEIEWAGANIPLWIINNNGEFTEIKPDKLSIGQNNFTEKYTNHKIKLQSSSIIYLFSDGFSDQFGGEFSKKLNKKNFKDLLISIHKLPLIEQENYLDNFIEAYKKNTEQTDDILVIGIRI